MDSKTVSLIIILLAGLGIYLHWNGKLTSVYSTLSSPATIGGTHTSLAVFVIAFFVYVFVISFMDEQTAIELTALLVLGGLLYNHELSVKNGQPDLVTQITGIGSK